MLRMPGPKPPPPPPAPPPRLWRWGPTSYRRRPGACGAREPVEPVGAGGAGHRRVDIEIVIGLRRRRRNDGLRSAGRHARLRRRVGRHRRVCRRDHGGRSRAAAAFCAACFSAANCAGPPFACCCSREVCAVPFTVMDEVELLRVPILEPTRSPKSDGPLRVRCALRAAYGPGNQPGRCSPICPDRATDGRYRAGGCYVPTVSAVGDRACSVPAEV